MILGQKQLHLLQKWSITINCKKHGRCVRDVTRRFLKSIFEAQSGRRQSSPSWLPDNRKGQKGGMWAELVAETTPTKHDSGDRSGNPPVTQEATPLIMQNFLRFNII